MHFKKEWLWIAGIAIMASSCGNNNNNGEASHAPATEQEASADKEVHAKTDPVCHMVYEPVWTDFTVHNNDTIWFCSEYCLTAFNSNPAKFGY